MLILAIEKAVGLIVLLHLSVGCCCFYLGQRESMEYDWRSGTSSQKTIQICGPELTSVITSMCDGYLGSPSDGNSVKSNKSKLSGLDEFGVAEKCCKKPCDLEFLLQHCGDSKTVNRVNVFPFKRDTPEVTNDLTRLVKKEKNADSGSESRRMKPKAGSSLRKKNGTEKVRIRERDMKRPRKKGISSDRGRKKRKPRFKWECTYKSFGHYLLKLDHDIKTRNKIRKRDNAVLHPIEVGTISPQAFGGLPVVTGIKSSRYREMKINQSEAKQNRFSDRSTLT